MNPELAYEQHTNLGRALTRAGIGTRTWMDRWIGNYAGRNAAGVSTVHIFDRALIARRNAEAGDTPIPAAVMSYVGAAEADLDADDDLVGVIDPLLIFGEGNPPPSAPAGMTEALIYPVGDFTEATCWQLAAAPTFYVTANMSRLLAHAAEAMDETDVMPHYPRYPTGFVVLAEPLELPYGDGTTQTIDAFGWTAYGQVLTNAGTVGHTGIVWQFVDRTRHPNDAALPRARQHYPSDTAWKNSPELVPQLGDAFITGTLIGGTVEKPQAAGDARAPGFPVGRFQPYLAAFLLLLAQKITAPEVAPVHEARTRRARKVTAARPSSVTVVDLRRRPRSSAGPTLPGRKLENQFLVAGGWKWQPYGPNRRLRKRIYIADYIRGPEDAPLILKPRVSRV